MKKLLFLLALYFVQMSFAQENNLRKIISNNSQNVKIRDNKNFQNVLYVINGMPTFSDCSAINVQNEIFRSIKNLSISVYRDNRLVNKHLYFPKLHLHKL